MTLAISLDRRWLELNRPLGVRHPRLVLSTLGLQILHACSMVFHPPRDLHIGGDGTAVAVGANIEGAFIAAGRNSPGGSQMLFVCVKILPGNSSEEIKPNPFCVLNILNLPRYIFSVSQSRC